MTCAPLCGRPRGLGSIADEEVVLPSSLRPESTYCQNRALPQSRNDSSSVIYSADRGTIITGRQVADLAEVSLPEDVIWLQ